MSQDKADDCEEKKVEENEQKEEKTDDPKNSESNEKICTKEERNEYFGKLEKWLHEANAWRAWQTFVATFPYYMMSNPIINPLVGINSMASSPSTTGFTSAQSGQRAGVQPGSQTLQIRIQEQTGPFQPPGVEGYEYKIPPFWKRCFAEFIDSMMLFCLKLGVTFLVVDMFDFIDIDPYDLNNVQRNLRIDYKMALEFTTSILILELIHRIIVCIFEAFCLQGGLNGRIGGATPGKSFMGLRVVQCHSVTPIERPADNGEYVLVSPGTNLGLPLSFGRSFVKNLILAFIFPICFAIFFFRFNRTGYDLLCNSIVVEDPYRNQNTNNNQNNRLHRPQL